MNTMRILFTLTIGIGTLAVSSASADELFNCTLKDGGLLTISADKNMRLATVVGDKAATKEITDLGMIIPPYLKVQPIDGDSKAGDKDVEFNNYYKVPDSIVTKYKIQSGDTKMYVNLLISFSKAERAGQKLKAGENIDFNGGIASVTWSLVDENEIQSITDDSGKKVSRLQVANIPIKACTAGKDLGDVNDVDKYETH